jgi:hypothetical protein
VEGRLASPIRDSQAVGPEDRPRDLPQMPVHRGNLKNRQFIQLQAPIEFTFERRLELLNLD